MTSTPDPYRYIPPPYPPRPAPPYGYPGRLPPVPTADRPYALALRILEGIFAALAGFITFVCGAVAVIFIGVILYFLALGGMLEDPPPVDPTDTIIPTLWSPIPLLCVSMATIAALVLGLIRKISRDREALPPWPPVSMRTIARRAHAAALTASVVLAPLAWMNIVAACLLATPSRLPWNITLIAAAPLLIAAVILTASAIALGLTSPERRVRRPRQHRTGPVAATTGVPGEAG